MKAAQVRACVAARLGPLLRRCGDSLGVPARGGLSVRLTNDATLRELNARFLGTDEATDVLSFPGDACGAAIGGEKPPAPRYVGDIAISVERALVQAQDGAAELRLLAVHGLLHCLGHDHAGATGAAAMTAVTRRLLPDQIVPEL